MKIQNLLLKTIKVLDEQFPKGDKRRGDALLLLACINVELEEFINELKNGLGDLNYMKFIKDSLEYNDKVIELIDKLTGNLLSLESTSKEVK